jgi:hypothetical protein
MRSDREAAFKAVLHEFTTRSHETPSHLGCACAGLRALDTGSGENGALRQFARLKIRLI